MYFWDSVLVVFRRWRVVLPALLVALLIAGVAAKLVPASYEATGTVVLIAPTGQQGAGDNPVVDSLGLPGTADVITQIVGSDASRQMLKDVGATGSYTVTRLANSNAPALVVTVKGGSPTVVMTTLQAVIRKMQSELTAQQALAGAKGQVIQANTVAADTKAVQVHGNRLRAAIAIGGLGVIAAISSAFIAESEATRRNQRRAASGPASGASQQSVGTGLGFEGH